MPGLDPFREKMLRGEVCFGTAITFTDPTITELLAGELDFVWIDAEHNALSLESIQLHLMAVKGTQAFPVVRVAWNDPVLLKPVLDIGAPGVVVPLIRTADDAALAVAACRYPPKGIRGFGPRRASRYGRDSGPEYCAAADASIMVNVQIEHAEAVKNLDAILATEGLSGIVIGPNDLAGSMGHPGRPDHPDVQKSIDTVIARARAAKKFVGVGASAEPGELADWARRGVQWLMVGADFALLRKGTVQTIAATRAKLAPPGHS
ncbi:MAG TPA: aldolase/citrate lyase family protein [Planctomycetaceae bacterium]|jgi:2-keto-3-deoxy-L-rhamnonate aldolase RhmA|nr:aldolase/citrate lyase family protein [Planctomycetaceae bacterium]